MKHVLSVSIGSGRRNHAVEIELLGEKVRIERIGTDGDLQKAIELVHEWDGKVSAFGMGGIDRFLVGAGGKKYYLRSAKAIYNAAKISPMLDGGGMKHTLERNVVQFVQSDLNITLKGREVLMVSGLDRFGMAEALDRAGAHTIYGDVMFALGIKWPIDSLKKLHRLGAALLPIISQVPFKMLYPTGEKQNLSDPDVYKEFYRRADVIAGDYLYISRYLPMDLSGKIILSNTVTPQDVQRLKERGCAMLVTSTPDLNGRSFGTNVLEALCVAMLEKPADRITPEDYQSMLSKLPFSYRVERFAEIPAHMRAK